MVGVLFSLFLVRFYSILLSFPFNCQVSVPAAGEALETTKKKKKRKRLRKTDELSEELADLKDELRVVMKTVKQQRAEVRSWAHFPSVLPTSYPTYFVICNAQCVFWGNFGLILVLFDAAQGAV